MRKVLLLLALTAFFSPNVNSDVGDTTTTAADSSGYVEITILYDNVPNDGRLQTDWGFACIIKGFDKTILFDTGTRGEILLANMDALGINPTEVDIVVLSHAHGDHVGSLSAFLRINSAVTVFMPHTFPKQIKNVVRNAGSRLVEVEPGMEICRGLYSTGVMGEAIPEAGVYFGSTEGLVLLTGCAHPGIVEMAGRAKSLSGKQISLVMGGFHLGRLDDAAVGGVIAGLKELGAKGAMPVHCSGDRARELFRQAFGENFGPGGPGHRSDFAVDTSVAFDTTRAGNIPAVDSAVSTFPMVSAQGGRTSR